MKMRLLRPWILLLGLSLKMGSFWVFLYYYLIFFGGVLTSSLTLIDKFLVVSRTV